MEDNNIYKAIEMYTESIDMDTILEQTEIVEEDLRKKLKELKLDRSNSRVLSQELYDRMETLYIRGNKMVDISKTLLVSDSCIRKYLRDHKIPPHTISYSNRKYNRDVHYFDIIDSPNKAYILGLLFADGNNLPDHNAITISLQEQDYEVLANIRKELCYEGPLRFNALNDKNSNYQNQWTLVINDEHMSVQLEKLGVIKNKSLVLMFPTCVPNKLLRHFVRGYFDGDGCVWFDINRNKCQTQTCGTLDVCTHIKELMEIIGCECFITHPSQSGDNNTFLIRTAANKSSYKFLSWIYDDLRSEDIRMERKYQAYLQFKSKYNYQGNTKSSIV